LEDVQAEGLKRQDPVYYEEQRKAGYIKGVEENRPAVISINTQFAGLAINESILANAQHLRSRQEGVQPAFCNPCRRAAM